jgi:hypothetical protein
MRRLFLVAALVGLFILALVMLVLGTFPPDPRPHPVEKVLPNDRFRPPSPGLGGGSGG